MDPHVHEDLVGLTATEQLFALEAIKKLFAARLRCMDTKDWDGYASFHTDDVVSDSWNSPGAARPAGDRETGTAGGGGPVVGGAALTTAIRGTLDGDIPVTSVHHGHTPEITFTSESTATGVWAMEDRLWFTKDSTIEWLHGYGFYHEEYRKVDGRWLISYRRLERLKVDATPGFYAR